MKKNTTNNATTATATATARRMTYKEFRAKYDVFISPNLGGKLDGVSVVTTSCKENPFCKARKEIKGSICAGCYADSGLNLKKAAREAYARNTEILPYILIPLEDMPRLYSETGYFRFESHGDLMSEIQVVNYFNMAAANPHMQCGLWTKNPWFIDGAMKHYGIKKPANLVIVASSYMENEYMNFSMYPFIDKVMTVYTEEYAKEHGIEIQCGGRSCAECGRCYENRGGRIVNELKHR